MIPARSNGYLLGQVKSIMTLIDSYLSDEWVQIGYFTAAII
jgi:hypothetical protein